MSPFLFARVMRQKLFFKIPLAYSVQAYHNERKKVVTHSQLRLRINELKGEVYTIKCEMIDGIPVRSVPIFTCNTYKQARKKIDYLLALKYNKLIKILNKYLTHIVEKSDKKYVFVSLLVDGKVKNVMEDKSAMINLDDPKETLDNFDGIDRAKKMISDYDIFVPTSKLKMKSQTRISTSNASVLKHNRIKPITNKKLYIQDRNSGKLNR